MSEVVALRDTGNQQSFEGMEIGEHRISLKSANNLPTDRRIGPENHVKGTFDGVLEAIEHQRGPDGKWRRVQKITILDAEVTEVTPNGYESGLE